MDGTGFSKLRRQAGRPLLLLGLGCALAGCHTAASNPPPPKNGSARSTLYNCYSLLHELLDQQKDVSKLRFLKHEEPDVKELVKRIASASRAGAKQLEAFAKQDPSIVLEDLRLPAGEARTREAIETTKRKELLGQSGDEFEVSLLLDQTEALTYAWHLAKVAAQNEQQPDRARYLGELSEEMKNLNRDVVSLLLVRMNSPAVRGNRAEK